MNSPIKHKKLNGTGFERTPIYKRNYIKICRLRFYEKRLQLKNKVQIDPWIRKNRR
ncbi:hypothetical protein LEP1GSC084_3168 [Leptospira interrogans serovar Medanensis str. L0448]|uniref:Uncharacterized protein n=1 Tax=Leptospira interrogans str. 2006001854 TaxID=1001590 RepID=M6GZU7_LEPIR|nr:hypothetical protein LEP1GSC099_0653 [Leptospira interrogans str. UI 08452]EMM84446.1 hypothetical protein LEP1GSC037_1433 [Leptospira interrogans str. 2006001854]EMN37372.1 hypothetical protein LEP1GSC084_3168 [Leptospira interrogans serovar Medanensis str. L0448]EMN39216.1 hypothetical protein LEP1GSC085_1642 [Leptospira interrogans str. L0996]EMN93196.1 hypothetical protein LEP1GSC110_4544 [Leptospira interrogans serovar Medanensis str. UT053]